MKHIIWVPFSSDRSAYTPDRQWVEERAQIFTTFTLQSILRQNFKDFEIWLLCGERHREFTENHAWHTAVNTVYDYGESRLQDIDDDFAAFTRIDSDDLFHEDALLKVDTFAKDMADKRGLVGGVFQDFIVWNRMLRYLAHYRPHAQPPFTTRIYPKKLYKNNDYFLRTMCTPHGKVTAKVCRYSSIPGSKVCVVKHGTNTSLVKKGKGPRQFSEKERADLMKTPAVITEDQATMEKILLQYGVYPYYARRYPDTVFYNNRFNKVIHLEDLEDG